MSYSVLLTRLMLLAIVLLSTACATSPTGRKQLKLFPESQMSQMGISSYGQMKKDTPLSKNRSVINYVNCVANAITAETTSAYQWEVNVFADEAVNAFALPGGKMGVYKGLLQVAINQHQLAAVLGHEVAHVLANHGNERVSVAFAADSGMKMAQVLAGEASAQKSQLLALLGLGTQVGVLLPYGRTQESEADVLGLEYMAKAGFDPRQSITLWENMGKASGKKPPELLSTHPSNKTRIDGLNRQMEKAMALYRQARANNKKPNCR
ncbi:MAG: M48 family metalloprotease [Gammaproteobacteria bacterium]|nr:M48 family metalloprotease [Gammaproteobacteria bacterium]